MTIAIAGARRPARGDIPPRPAVIAHPLAIAALLACAALASPTTAAAQHAMPSIATVSHAGQCFDTTATVVPARLDDEHLIYVEQETVVANRDGRILVAGAPVFVWRNAGDRYDLLALDSLFGMIVEPSSKFVHPIPSPLPGHDLKGMRAAALSDGWWLVTFAEVVSVQHPTPRNVIAMWVGETDGSRWRALEKLPAVSDTLDPHYFSALAMHDGRVRFVTRVRRDWQRRVVIYSRDAGRWTVRTDDLGLSEAVAITVTASSDLLAVARPDTTLRVDHNSLFLYSKAPADTIWTSHPRLWHGGNDPVQLPLFVGKASDPLLLWVTGPMFRATSAWALSLSAVSRSADAAIPMPAHASSLAAASLGEMGVMVTLDRFGPEKELRVFEYERPSRVRLVFSKPTEFRGLLAVTLTGDRAVLVVSKPAEPPRDPAVISMIETHAWRCPIADARSP